MKLMAYKDTHTHRPKTCKKPETIPATWKTKKTTTASINKENVQVKLQR